MNASNVKPKGILDILPRLITLKFIKGMLSPKFRYLVTK